LRDIVAYVGSLAGSEFAEALAQLKLEPASGIGLRVQIHEVLSHELSEQRCLIA
jgi:hypothetical protein